MSPCRYSEQSGNPRIIRGDPLPQARLGTAYSCTAIKHIMSLQQAAACRMWGCGISLVDSDGNNPDRCSEVLQMYLPTILCHYQNDLRSTALSPRQIAQRHRRSPEARERAGLSGLACGRPFSHSRRPSLSSRAHAQ